MQQVVLTRQIFRRVDDEDNTTPDQKAAVFAAVIPLITNPIVSHQAVEAYRQYVISSEGKPQQTASKTPEADALFERLTAPYKGNALYLDFWAMYCGPCKTDMLNQRKKVERLKDKPVRFLYICDERDSSREKAEKWMQDNNIKGYQGPALINHGTADRVVPYTYGERFHEIWPKSELVIQDYFDHGFSQNIYRSTDIVADFLIRQLK